MAVTVGSDHIITCRGVVKRFGAVTALDRLDLSVPRGAVVGYLGPNGAGKSTTIRLLLDLARPDAGDVRVFGHDPRDRPELRRRIGYLPGELRLDDRLRVDETLRSWARLRGGVDGGYADELCARLGLDVHRQTKVLPISITRSPLPDNRDWAVVVIRDDTDRQRTEADLFRQATHDSLTGLANRALLLDRLERIERRRRTQLGPLTVLFVDLDRFKQVNDIHGHAAGDEVLQVVADALEHTFRPSDTVARVGGDEFVVLCEDTGADDGTALAARATAAVRAAARALAYSASQDVSASVGVVCA